MTERLNHKNRKFLPFPVALLATNESNGRFFFVAIVIWNKSPGCVGHQQNCKNFLPPGFNVNLCNKFMNKFNRCMNTEIGGKIQKTLNPSPILSGTMYTSKNSGITSIFDKILRVEGWAKIFFTHSGQKWRGNFNLGCLIEFVREDLFFHITKAKVLQKFLETKIFGPWDSCCKRDRRRLRMEWLVGDRTGSVYNDSVLNCCVEN